MVALTSPDRPDRLFGLAVLQSPNGAILGPLLFVLGVVAIINAPKQAIEVMNSGGGVIRFPVSLLERSRTVEFANLVSEAVARPTTRCGIVTSGSVAPTPPGADPSEALRQLNRLREHGLISEAEYTAKRGEILGRLQRALTTLGRVRPLMLVSVAAVTTLPCAACRCLERSASGAGAPWCCRTTV